MRVRLESIGCRLNIGEIEEIARRLAGRGCRVVGPGQPADLCIFNSCTVTSIASRKSRQMIRQLRRSNPGAAIVATGCDSELAPEQIRALGVSLVVSNRDKDRLPELLDEHGLLPVAELLDDGDDAHQPVECGGRTRAFVKVQDGCDNRCTFCIVTVARGSGRSRPAGEVIDEIRRLVECGYREAVLSGVHLGSYGHDFGQKSGLENLVVRLLADTEISRLRLSSLEPWDVDGDFLRLFEDRRLLPHLHLPLQSGSDLTLRRMGRKVTRRTFSDLVEAARSVIPNVSISTDVMVGFPGETDRDFEDSIAFVAAMGFSRLHVFRYSIRPGTAAATLPRQVPGSVSRERSRRVIELGARQERVFNNRFVGSVLPVLWEERDELDTQLRWSGLTDNYIRVVTETEPDVDLTNRVTATRLITTIPGGTLGEIDGVTVPRMIEPAARRESRLVVLGSSS